MPRTKSRRSHVAASRKSRSSRTTARPQRRDEADSLRRYLDFIRAVLGATRAGR